MKTVNWLTLFTVCGILFHRNLALHLKKYIKYVSRQEKKSQYFTFNDKCIKEV